MGAYASCLFAFTHWFRGMTQPCPQCKVQLCVNHRYCCKGNICLTPVLCHITGSREKWVPKILRTIMFIYFSEFWISASFWLKSSCCQTLSSGHILDQAASCFFSNYNFVVQRRGLRLGGGTAVGKGKVTYFTGWLWGGTETDRTQQHECAGQTVAQGGGNELLTPKR